MSLTENTEKTTRVTSNMEKHVRYSGRSQEDSAEDQRDRRFTGHLQKYYEKVVSCVRDARAILILGPGEAKGELSTRLESEALGDRVVGIETADTMTDRQLVARIRQHYRRIVPVTGRTGLTER